VNNVLLLLTGEEGSIVVVDKWRRCWCCWQCVVVIDRWQYCCCWLGMVMLTSEYVVVDRWRRCWCWAVVDCPLVKQESLTTAVLKLSRHWRYQPLGITLQSGGICNNIDGSYHPRHDCEGIICILIQQDVWVTSTNNSAVKTSCNISGSNFLEHLRPRFTTDQFAESENTLSTYEWVSSSTYIAWGKYPFYSDSILWVKQTNANWH